MGVSGWELATIIQTPLLTQSSFTTFTMKLLFLFQRRLKPISAVNRRGVTVLSVGGSATWDGRTGGPGPTGSSGSAAGGQGRHQRNNSLNLPSRPGVFHGNNVSKVANGNLDCERNLTNGGYLSFNLHSPMIAADNANDANQIKITPESSDETLQDLYDNTSSRQQVSMRKDNSVHNSCYNFESVAPLAQRSNPSRRQMNSTMTSRIHDVDEGVWLDDVSKRRPRRVPAALGSVRKTLNGEARRTWRQGSHFGEEENDEDEENQETDEDEGDYAHSTNGDHSTVSSSSDGHGPPRLVEFRGDINLFSPIGIPTT